nr:nopL [Bradyrhizobium sp. DOA9]
MANGRRARDEWVFTGQTATPAQIELLRGRDLIPTRAARTTTSSNLGVPRRVEWQEEGFIRLNPS